MRHYVLRSILALCLLLGFSAMSSAPKNDSQLERLTFHWQEGSLPPPNHYAYKISLSADGAGRITFWPDYPGPGTPEWTEDVSFPVDQWQALEAMIAEHELARLVWPAPGMTMSVGGSLSSLDMDYGGARYDIPTFAIDEEGVREFYTLIKSLLPDITWASLRERHETYQESYDGQ